MTHMHIPDGVLPVWLWVSGLVVAAAVLAVCFYRARSMDMKIKVPLLGALSAAMLVAMSVPVLPGYHINLTVVTGILLGPSLGMIAAFIVNFLLALVGHGGITVVGLNTLLLGSETVLGYALFSVFRRLPVFWRSLLATVITLFVTTSLLIGIVAVAHLDPEVLHHGEEHAAVLHGRGSLSAFALIVLSVGSIGWIVEAAITGAVVRFIAQVKPDLLVHRLRRNAEGS